MESFGEKLRKQREQRGITLEAVANTTKISTRMLKALEDEHFDQLPGGVFNKGFVRAYARQVGLDEEEAINDYFAALAESRVTAQPSPPNFRAAAKPGRQIPTPSKQTTNASEDRRIHSDRRTEVRRNEDRQNGDSHHADQIHEDGIDDRVINFEDRRAARVERAAAQSHLAEDSLEDIPSAPPSFLNLSALEPQVHARPDGEPPPVTSSQRVRWQLFAVPVILITLALALWTYRRNHRREAPPTAASQVAPSLLPATTSAKPPAAPAPTTPTAKAVVSLPGATAPPTEPDSDVTTSSPHTQVSKPKPVPTFTLVIRASETCWVAITADGQPVAQETLIAPANTSVRAAHEITVKLGNAAGVSFLLNGKDISAEGNEGEVRTYTFDANGLRDSVPPAATTN